MRFCMPEDTEKSMKLSVLKSRRLDLQYTFYLIRKVNVQRINVLLLMTYVRPTIIISLKYNISSPI